MGGLIFGLFYFEILLFFFFLDKEFYVVYLSFLFLVEKLLFGMFKLFI